MNIAPDGTIYEILEDGTIKRIGKVSPNGEFEPFGGPKDGVRVRDGFIYRAINGKEQKIGRVLPNGEIESISQKIRSETEISRNKVKIVAILSVLIAFIIGAGIYLFEEEQEAREQRTRDAKIAEQEREKAEEYENKIKPVYAKYLEEKSPTSENLDSYIKQLNNLLKLQDMKHEENKNKVDEIVKEIETKKAEIILEEKKKDEEEMMKAEEYKENIESVYSEYQGKTSPKINDLESYISRLNKIKSELKYKENIEKTTNIIEEIEQKKKEAEAAKKAEEERRRQAAAAKKAKQEAYLKGRQIGGLIWSDHASSALNWSSAKQYCSDLEEGGFTDWRLPTISELRKLIKNCSSQSGGSCRVSDNCLSSDCGGGCCCDDSKGSYYNKLGDNHMLWSSSTVSNDTESAWTVLFLKEDVSTLSKGVHLHSASKSGSILFVRCVR